jgi:hypothetical protein
MTTSYSLDQMDEVWSWVHDEHKCVTSFLVTMTLGVSRNVASILLRDLPLHRDHESVMYEVTIATSIEGTFSRDEKNGGTKQTGEYME